MEDSHMCSHMYHLLIFHLCNVSKHGRFQAISQAGSRTSGDEAPARPEECKEVELHFLIDLGYLRTLQRQASKRNSILLMVNLRYGVLQSG